MRIAMLIAIAALAAGYASAGTHNESATYVEGNLSSVVANSGGWLVVGGENAIELKTGLATVAVPYTNVSKAELGAVRQHPSDVPMYKVWSLHKHFSKNETQFLKIEFKDDQGEQRNMTIELAKGTAEDVVESISKHNPQASTGQPAVAEAAKEKTWWGDEYWKTKRNAAKWEQQESQAK